MEELCKRFSEIRHRTEEKTFTTTFSCGVSCSNQYKTPSELFQAADDAMYAAKSAGRNRVLPAG
jgi:diguanylate cyclase (GGDEF)-like protein